MNHIVINGDKCKACYLCIKECPKNLIKISDKTNGLGNRVVEFEDSEHKCIACAMCATRCPDLAITGVFKD